MTMTITPWAPPFFTNPSTRVGYDTKSIFKWSLTGLNSEFFLLLDKLPHQGWRNQSVLLFTHSWRENNWIHTFPKGISAMWNAISVVQYLNSCCRVVPMTITIAAQAPPQINSTYKATQYLSLWLVGLIWGCFNIQETHWQLITLIIMLGYFFVSDFKIAYYNNY